jgi:ABC-type nitrate/sulfonate/bicarbonate transport system substrate-binding protein
MKHLPFVYSGAKLGFGYIRVFLLVISFILGTLSSAPAQTPAPILVAYAGQNETVGPMWVGIEKGTFKKYGLDVRLVQLRNGSLSMATLSSGQVQYNYGSPGNALSASSGGMKIQCVASAVHRIPRELIARKEIRTIEDLRGKTFGVQSIGGGFWLQTMIALDQLGIDPEKYDLKCAFSAIPQRSRRLSAPAVSTPRSYLIVSAKRQNEQAPTCSRISAS